jgi:hypothetical protein
LFWHASNNYSFKLLFVLNLIWVSGLWKTHRSFPLCDSKRLESTNSVRQCPKKINMPLTTNPCYFIAMNCNKKFIFLLKWLHVSNFTEDIIGLIADTRPIPDAQPSDSAAPPAEPTEELILQVKWDTLCTVRMFSYPWEAVCRAFKYISHTIK